MRSLVNYMRFHTMRFVTAGVVQPEIIASECGLWIVTLCVYVGRYRCFGGT
jgi:hypothetical protein